MKRISPIHAGGLLGGLSLAFLTFAGCSNDVAVDAPSSHGGTGGAGSAGTGANGDASGTGNTGTSASGTSTSGTSTSGTGASGTGATSCPATQPAADSACPSIGADCTYGGTQCACEFTNTWQCSSCPAALPANMSPCTPGMNGLDVCDYAATQCVCLGPGSAAAWTCESCPATKPAQASDCSSTSFIGGFFCSYGAAQCTCRLASGNTWDCGTMTCPATQPAPGVACDIAATMPCEYGSVKCYCMGDQFFCN